MERATHGFRPAHLESNGTLEGCQATFLDFAEFLTYPADDDLRHLVARRVPEPDEGTRFGDVGQLELGADAPDDLLCCRAFRPHKKMIKKMRV
jgi:hypothetical protein